MAKDLFILHYLIYVCMLYNAFVKNRLFGTGSSYTGPTEITTGELAVTGSGTLAASSSIHVPLGAILNVSGTSIPYTVPSGQTLFGNGTIIGPITLPVPPVSADRFFRVRMY